jgi:hypothetical protein
LDERVLRDAFVALKPVSASHGFSRAARFAHGLNDN